MHALEFRLAQPSDQAAIRKLILDSFEPITWFKRLDEQFGPLNNCDWRARWEQRLDKVFETEIVLVGECGGELVAAATGSIDEVTRLGFIDLLAVDVRHQGKGFGRAMLEGMLDHFRALGMQYAHLECLSDNDRANALYASAGWRIVATAHKWFVKL